MQARIRILKGGVGANRKSLPANQSEKTRWFSILELAPAWAWFAALAVDSIVVCCPTAAATEQSASRAANFNEKTGFKFFIQRRFGGCDGPLVESNKVSFDVVP